MAVIFRYKNGRIIPIKVDEEQTTNEYMNNKIRNKKEYAEKDIKKLYDFGEIYGYELNGIYLLKSPMTVNKWVINLDKNERPSMAIDYDLGIANRENEGRIIEISNYKEGKEKLIELANKKK